jgi:putative tryptophan/tyrosine transport system substrate-binding protein
MRRRELLLLLATNMMATRAVRAQQKAMPVVGYLGIGSRETDRTLRLEPFRMGLGETGYVEGQNVVIEYRWARGQYDRLPELAGELVRQQVTVIAAMSGSPPALAAKASTSTIPIVFVLGIDPIASGLVASLNRPGGNITGVSVLSAELTAKRLEAIHELLPSATTIALLGNPDNPVSEAETKTSLDAARLLGFQVRVLQARTASEITPAFDTLAELRADALVVVADPLFTNARAQIAELAAKHKVPAIYATRELVAAGGLMSYGIDLVDSIRQAGVMAGKIIKGAKPADLPVQQVVKVLLTINLMTAKTLGLTIPPILLGRADEVIE